MNKQLDESTILSELRDGSSFFKKTGPNVPTPPRRKHPVSAPPSPLATTAAAEVTTTSSPPPATPHDVSETPTQDIEPKPADATSNAQPPVSSPAQSATKPSDASAVPLSSDTLPNNPALETSGVSAETRLPEAPPARSHVRVRRTIGRQSFELFHDQMKALKQFSLEEQLMGEKGSMSQMVREALDTYIAKRTRTGE